ncbi:MAG: glycosyltransferase [Oscillospiraceae bacterium]|nr:glycosyltransferase [Oscillospiraceae bacterium]
MEIFDLVCSALLILTGILVVHRHIYTIIGLFIKPVVYPETNKLGRYAIVIAARNEEAVIGNLIDSIHAQDYNPSLLTTFVVADNCTDNTARVCRDKGAVVYERFNKEKARKGYALEFLFENIKADYGIEAFDGYFVFDADNLLMPDYVSQMNKAFSTGKDIVTSYRKSKNFDTNFISAAYGIHFHRNSMALHRPRAVMDIGTHITGTGFLIASHLLADGWKFHNLTEDDQFTSYISSKGYKTAFCDNAEFYDEQPTDFQTSYKQRLRWAKGRFTGFFQHGSSLLKGIFKHKSFTCYDMFSHYFPYGLISLLVGVIYPLSGVLYNLFSQGAYDFQNMAENIIAGVLGLYLSSLLMGILTVIREYNRINCSPFKLLLYTFLFPWFDLISLPVLTLSLFQKVKWAPIVHKDTTRIADIPVLEEAPCTGTLQRNVV